MIYKIICWCKFLWLNSWMQVNVEAEFLRWTCQKLVRLSLKEKWILRTRTANRSTCFHIFITRHLDGPQTVQRGNYAALRGRQCQFCSRISGSNPRKATTFLHVNMEISWNSSVAKLKGLVFTSAALSLLSTTPPPHQIGNNSPNF